MSGNAEASEPTGGASFLLDTNVLIDVLKGEPQALAVASKAVELRRTLGIKIPDAIILATARCHQRQLVSRNTRDFPVTLGDVVVPYQL